MWRSRRTSQSSDASSSHRASIHAHRRLATCSSNAIAVHDGRSGRPGASPGVPLATGTVGRPMGIGSMTRGSGRRARVDLCARGDAPRRCAPRPPAGRCRPAVRTTPNSRRDAGSTFETATKIVPHGEYDGVARRRRRRRRRLLPVPGEEGRPPFRSCCSSARAVPTRSRCSTRPGSRSTSRSRRHRSASPRARSSPARSPTRSSSDSRRPSSG